MPEEAEPESAAEIAKHGPEESADVANAPLPEPSMTGQGAAAASSPTEAKEDPNASAASGEAPAARSPKVPKATGIGFSATGGLGFGTVAEQYTAAIKLARSLEQENSKLKTERRKILADKKTVVEELTLAQQELQKLRAKQTSQSPTAALDTTLRAVSHTLCKGQKERPPELLPVVVQCRQNERCRLPGNALTLTRAWYGLDGKEWNCRKGAGMDVTDKVRQMCESGPYVTATSAAFGEFFGEEGQGRKLLVELLIPVDTGHLLDQVKKLKKQLWDMTASRDAEQTRARVLAEKLTSELKDQRQKQGELIAKAGQYQKLTKQLTQDLNAEKGRSLMRSTTESSLKTDNMISNRLWPPSSLRYSTRKDERDLQAFLRERSPNNHLWPPQSLRGDGHAPRGP